MGVSEINQLVLARRAFGHHHQPGQKPDQGVHFRMGEAGQQAVPEIHHPGRQRLDHARGRAASAPASTTRRSVSLRPRVTKPRSTIWSIRRVSEPASWQILWARSPAVLMRPSCSATRVVHCEKVSSWSCEQRLHLRQQPVGADAHQIARRNSSSRSWRACNRASSAKTPLLLQGQYLSGQYLLGQAYRPRRSGGNRHFALASPAQIAATKRHALFRLCPGDAKSGWPDNHLCRLDPGPGPAAGRAQWQSAGAKTTRGRAWVLVYAEKHRTRKGAMRREFVLKNDRNSAPCCGAEAAFRFCLPVPAHDRRGSGGRHCERP